MEKTKEKYYSIRWHNLIVVDTIQEAVDQIDGIRKSLEPLLKLEQEGHIKGNYANSQPSIQSIEILREEASHLVEQNPLVSTTEIEMDDE